ncbi:unnamed protein product [Acanthosepion pharaonis]|uniref:Uncharacterized protein n=1 Tax=Acanthosepion pharaonis TaxID=158019 RepID=A0A812CZ08_ACAPH|nr:unnamed protein product [Sepia pharaonis]
MKKRDPEEEKPCEKDDKIAEEIPVCQQRSLLCRQTTENMASGHCEKVATNQHLPSIHPSVVTSDWQLAGNSAKRGRKYRLLSSHRYHHCAVAVDDLTAAIMASEIFPFFFVSIILIRFSLLFSRFYYYYYHHQFILNSFGFSLLAFFKFFFFFFFFVRLLILFFFFLLFLSFHLSFFFFFPNSLYISLSQCFSFRFL